MKAHPKLDCVYDTHERFGVEPVPCQHALQCAAQDSEKRLRKGQNKTKTFLAVHIYARERKRGKNVRTEPKKWLAHKISKRAKTRQKRKNKTKNIAGPQNMQESEKTLKCRKQKTALLATKYARRGEHVNTLKQRENYCWCTKALLVR